MTKTYLGLFGALSAVALLAAGCDEAKYPASENTQAVEAPVEQPAYQAEAGAQVGSGFDLATAEGREAAKSALGEGWHEIEDGGHVWQASNVADMTLAIPPGKEREATIYISSFLPKPGQTVDVDVSLDEEELQNYSLENGAPDAVVKLDFPPSEEASTHTVAFRVSQLFSPSEEIEGNPDDRKLGILLRRVDIDAN